MSATSLRSPRVWAAPFVLVLLVSAALAALYLGGTLNSATSLRAFPVAVVNDDAAAATPGARQPDVAALLAGALRQGVDHHRFAVSTPTLAEAGARMDRGHLYGAIVIPRGFDAALRALAGSATTAMAAPRPTITVLTNPRAGTAVPGVVTGLASAALPRLDAAAGTALLAALPPSAAAAPLSGAARTTLAAPFGTVVTPYRPLPTGTGGGLAPFYYALIIVLAGFTGSVIVSTLVDGSLGFVPTELGPVYLLRRSSGVSRLATLRVKWLVMLALAVAVSAAYLGIAAALGMPVDHPVTLWLFAAGGIVAVSAVAQAVIAVFGGLGLLVNLFLFVVLALPSSGGTLPLEATPRVFRVLGSFEPMHQLYVGARSVLYFDATLDSGLGRALVFFAAATAAGLLVGAGVARAYDRRGSLRGGMPTTVAPAVVVPVPVLT